MSSAPAPQASRSSVSSQATPSLRAASRGLPAWLLSAVLHLTVMLGLGMAMRFAPQGAAPEPQRSGGIVMVSHLANKTEYLTEGDVESSAPQNAADSAAADQQSPLPDQSELPVDLAGLLPSPGDLVGLGSDIGEALPDASGLTGGVGPNRRVGGQVRTGVFGVQGTGSKFVYVFDRSGSMEGFQGRPLAAAKRELIASLEHLESVHQFQIIFYNERPHVLNPNRLARPRLMYGSDSDKRLAVDFIRAVRADGGTRHMAALKLAVNMRPDVIFFLTDAEEPQLNADELLQIGRLNRFAGASVNTIQFGSGPPRGGDNFLKKLARQNGGQHVYIDISKLPKAR